VGFENLNPENLRQSSKTQNLNRDYSAMIRRVHGEGVMINGSFVFGMDEDGPDVFERTVDWTIEQSIETATFHIMTPYPSTALYARIAAEGRLLHRDWNRYDTRHTVFQPRQMSEQQLEDGYWRAYRSFYRWSSILGGASHKETTLQTLRHIAYSGGWKKFEGLWNGLIRLRQVSHMLPVLEKVLLAWGNQAEQRRKGFDSLSTVDTPSSQADL